MLAVACLLGLPARPAAADDAAAAYHPLSGPYEVAVDEVVWQDPARDRTIKTLVYAPKETSGKLPLILFSPGLGGSHQDYSYLGRAWAGHGYLTVTFDHPGSNRAIFEAGGREALRKAILQRENVVLRVGDIEYVLDRLLGGDAGHAGLEGRIDADRLVIAGHSYGAYTTMACAGLAFEYQGDHDHTIGDPRFEVAIAMGTQGIEDLFFGIHEHSWDPISIPVMTMTGTRDGGSRGQDYTWRNQAYEHLHPDDKYNVVIAGAGHNSYYDMPPLIPQGKPTRDPRHWGWIETTTLAYLDAYVKGNDAAKAWLRGGEPARYTGGEMDIQWK